MKPSFSKCIDRKVVKKGCEKMVLPVGFLIALWLIKKLLQYARQAIRNARYKERYYIADCIERSEPEPEPDYIADPDYDFPVENENDPEKIAMINERVERISGLIHDNNEIIAAIEKELSGTIKDARRTTLLAKKATVAEKIYRLEKQIDKEKGNL